MDEKRTAHVLNSYLTFERVLYVVGNYSLPRPIPFKTALYFILFAGILFLGGFIPLIGGLFSGISVIYKLGIAVFIAMWLTTYGTEERSPISFFASYLRYHFLTPARVGYFQGREIPAERKTNFSNKAYVVEADEEPKETWITLATMKGADNIE